MKETNLRILFDSNVIIDALTIRPDCEQSSLIVFKQAIAGSIQGYLVSKQITDIYYCLRKYYSNEKRKTFIQLLIRSFIILPFTPDDIDNALTLKGNDFEDDVLLSVGLKFNLNYIVTNNVKHFNNEKAITPTELLNVNG